MIEITHEACGKTYPEYKWKGIEDHIKNCEMNCLPETMLHRINKTELCNTCLHSSYAHLGNRYTHICFGCMKRQDL